MSNRFTALALTAAALTFACGGNPEPVTPEPASVEAPAAQAPAAQAPAAQTPAEPAATATLSDERAMELASGYVELLQAGDFAQLWEHLAPAAKERFGTLEKFQTEGARIMNELGPEVATIREAVEQPRAGMQADKLYLRVSHYATAGETPVRMMIGLMNDGSIIGMNVSRAQ